MPIAPQNEIKPYATVGEVLELARVIVNDAFGPNGLEGDLLSKDQPYTSVLLNSAWDQIQEELVDSGVEAFTKEIILPSITPVSVTDPSVSIYLTWDGFFDGVNLIDNADGVPTLPFDLIQPLKVWERIAGSGSAFCPVTPADGGLPEGYQQDRMRWYEWRDDKLYMKGATQAIELKMRYAAYRPELWQGDVPDEAELVPLMRSKRAMAYLIASEFSRARGASFADNLYAMGTAEIAKIANRTARRKAFVSYRRQAFGS